MAAPTGPGQPAPSAAPASMTPPEPPEPPEPHNWGRWGVDDQRGAMNLVTPDVIRSAAGLVREGRIVSLSQPIEGATAGLGRQRVPVLQGRPRPQVFMAIDGADYAAGSRPIGPGRLSMADDALVLSPHGTTTHIDAFSHAWQGDRLYNGHDARRVRSTGAGRLGIENLPGVVTRGVLLDMAGHRGVPHLAATDRIDGAELAACAEAAGATVGSGDAVVIRTGWPTTFATDPDLYWSGQPGLSADGGEWLARRDVCLVAADNGAISGLNAKGGSDEEPHEDLHLLFLWRCGIHLVEMLWLEELAATGRTEFLLLLAPLRIVGGTGSPVNPLAVL
jgi:kynurenine formamidase